MRQSSGCFQKRSNNPHNGPFGPFGDIIIFSAFDVVLTSVTRNNCSNMTSAFAHSPSWNCTKGTICDNAPAVTGNMATRCKCNFRRPSLFSFSFSPVTGLQHVAENSNCFGKGFCFRIVAKEVSKFTLLDCPTH